MIISILKNKKALAIIGIAAVMLLISGQLTSLSVVDTSAKTFINRDLKSKMFLDKDAYIENSAGETKITVSRVLMTNTRGFDENPSPIMVSFTEITIFEYGNPSNIIKTDTWKTVEPIYLETATSKSVSNIISTTIKTDCEAITVKLIAGVRQADGLLIKESTIGMDSATIKQYVEPPSPATTDTDGDGFNDDIDAFPNDKSEWKDTDGDGVGDNSDYYPMDGTRWKHDPLPIIDTTDTTNVLISPESPTKLYEVNRLTNTTITYDGKMAIKDGIITVDRADGNVSTFDTANAEIVNGNYKFTDDKGNTVYIPTDFNKVYTSHIAIILIGLIASLVVLVLPHIPPRGKIFLLAIVAGATTLMYYII